MEWLRNLSSAIDYIENNLDKEISYEEAARIACCSPFYFQRLFSYVSGISLSEYIRRRKMTQAAFELQRTNAKVIDIALKYGYTSPTAFNRAFRSVHHITPAAARQKGSPLHAYPAMHFSVQITGGAPMTYHIGNKPSMRIVGVRIPLTERMDENQQIIPRFWASVLESGEFSRLCALSRTLPSEKSEEAQSAGCAFPGKILGVSAYEPSRRMFYYIAVSTDRPVPRGMYACEIPQAQWAVFENSGSFKEDVQRIFQRFFTEWLPFSGYMYAGLPDIEVYPICESVPAGGHSEVWIAIKKSREDESCIISS